jgi:hypothetical protein
MRRLSRKQSKELGRKRRVQTDTGRIKRDTLRIYQVTSITLTDLGPAKVATDVINGNVINGVKMSSMGSSMELISTYHLGAFF